MNVICLANSYKHHGRCIAGIEVDSGQWIRPVSTFDDGRIQVENRKINAENINILDIVSMPIDKQQKLGYEVESYGYRDFPWTIIGNAQVVNIVRYCEDQLLYPEFEKSIPFHYLQQKSKIRTLQLIEVKSITYHLDHQNPKKKWKAIINDSKYGISGVKISITDPIILNKLNQQESLSSHCLVCMSLSQPWPKDVTEESRRCYRLVAGTIELMPELEMITSAMNKIGWNVTQGRQYLQNHFGKQSRYQLTKLEAQQFLEYLKLIHENPPIL